MSAALNITPEPRDQSIRRRGLGGTDVAAIVGLHPNRTAFDVYLEKTGQLENAIEETDRMWAGKRLERVIAQMYSERTGRPHEWVDKTLPALAQASYKIWTPDALVDPNGGLDSKNVAFDQAWRWGEAGTSDVPDHIALQAQWYLDCSTRDWWDIAALVGGNDLRIYRLERDQDVIAMLREAAEKFWCEHVAPQIAPPMEYSSGAEKWLKQRFPISNGLLRKATEKELVLVRAYKEARLNLTLAEEHSKGLTLRLKEAIGDADGLKSPSGQVLITNRKSKDGARTDWESLAVPLLLKMAPEIAAELVELHTTLVAGSRRLLLKKEKENG